MRRTIALSLLSLAALAFAGPASAATPRPVITSVSPKAVAIGQLLTLKGKNFRKGGKNNRIYFRRASDGKTVRTRAKSATTTTIKVVVPTSLDQFLTLDANGNKQATRFQLGVFTRTFGPYTKKSRSPLIGPAGSVPGGPTAPGATPPPPPDCDKDGNPDATDPDDDNDGVPDTTEAQYGMGTCNKDSDGDGVEDGFEYWSALDLNGNAIPYPGKKPYPNPLDGSDAGKDFDGDGLTQAEEFAAWNLYGGRVLPTGAGQTFPYSDGNQTSTAAPGLGGADYDQNGKLTDEEKDADGDGLANWVELVPSRSTDPGTTGLWTLPNGSPCPQPSPPPPDSFGASGRYQDCGAGSVANGSTFIVAQNTITGAPMPAFVVPTNWLDPDTDGDTVNDAADDQDHDGISNGAEIVNQSNPVDPCAPSTESATCPQHE